MLGLPDFREILIPRSSLQPSATELGSNSCPCSIGNAVATDSGRSLYQCPTTVTKSRWLRALTRMTQKPFSAF